MLQIRIPARELFDENTSTFIFSKEQTLNLEHSLISISKWESKWKKSFMDNIPKMTRKEFIDYIRCMTIAPGIAEETYLALSEDNYASILSYINDSMTATTFRENSTRPSKQIITSEVVYYWMIRYGIPFECEKWHINRLMTLIRICAIKEGPGKKMSHKDTIAQNKALNSARRKECRSRG